ncbi:MAG: hypothetical protein ACTS41_01680 [Candidatus Hodgkinia cicadicola]
MGKPPVSFGGLKWITIPWLKWHSQWWECEGLKLRWCCSLLTYICVGRGKNVNGREQVSWAPNNEWNA